MQNGSCGVESSANGLGNEHVIGIFAFEWCQCDTVHKVFHQWRRGWILDLDADLNIELLNGESIGIV
jgi:hypothetical protein